MQSQSPAKSETQFYTWNHLHCAYEVQSNDCADANKPPLLLIQPIGVGLSRRFWDRFCRAWLQSRQPNQIYNPDLAGCGESDMPQRPYSPEDWADQLLVLLQTVIQRPVILIVQGASFPIAISLWQKAPVFIQGLILAGPPAWKIMSEPTADWQDQVSWSLFASPLGKAFYRYARRQQFIRSFSVRQLFADPDAVDAEWLSALEAGSRHLDSRYAVFSFLAGFWRRDWQTAIESLTTPTLVLIGNTASNISRSAKTEPPDQRMADYLKHLPQAEGKFVPGRNVLPYESTAAFVEAIVPFIQQHS
ncbi:alpha/beta fold hydrolase [Thermocoleostomius sinensis]|uniref:Alpha/beta hydrolase n=1 Tax=Thermocoleostomius sinensis A174 TaxID=2016057 RepID=A0A9E8ZC11_9CYAN|nr:alpha/beta hydrolase [Thermocoleostomius sinensis]WAL58485.1 alpha/beta hydrolase [Thermocoleostomius sinensis A174]